jgi:hypothetical protein
MHKIDLSWLAGLENDGLGLIVLSFAFLIIVALGCVRPVAKAIIQDRKCTRKWRVQRERLHSELESRRARLRKWGKLK